VSPGAEAVVNAPGLDWDLGRAGWFDPYYGLGVVFEG
jgi:hypothetical protein